MTMNACNGYTVNNLCDANPYVANSERRFHVTGRNIAFLILTYMLFGMSHAEADCSVVLLTENSIPENIVNLGEIKAGKYAFGVEMCNRNQVIQELKRQACDMGGTAIRIVSEKSPGLMRSCYSITAIVLDATSPNSSDSLSLESLRSLAERGETSAQYLLGMEYMSGERVGLDQVEAYAWFNVGAAQNHADAIRERDDLERVLSGDKLRQAQARSVDIWTSYYEVYGFHGISQ